MVDNLILTIILKVFQFKYLSYSMCNERMKNVIIIDNLYDKSSLF